MQSFENESHREQQDESKEVNHEYRDRLLSLKAELTEKEMALGDLVETLLYQVTEKTVYSLPQLMLLVEEKATMAGLDENQLEEFRRVLSECVRRERTVTEFSEQFPGAKEAFVACFKFEPAGEVEVVYGGVTIHFKIHSREDFQRAGVEGPQEEFPVRGYALYDVPNPLLKYIVTIEDCSHQDADSDDVRIHEEQHHLNSLIQIRIDEEEALKEVVDSLEDSTDLEVTKDRLLRALIFKASRETHYDEVIKDEILAQYRGGTDVDTIFGMLITADEYRFAENIDINHLADSVLQEANTYLLRLFGHEQQSSSITHSEVKSLIQTQIIDGHITYLRRWTNALLQLEQKGYSRANIIGLLYLVPIVAWPSYARRLPVKSGGQD